MGLISAVISLLQIRCGGLVHLGTVCTSFIFLNCATHTRSIAFPLGWRSHLDYVELGNVLASRSSILALLAWGLGAFPILEQPLRSMMIALPSWQRVVAYFDEAEKKGWVGQRLKLSKVNMACFRAPSPKPTALYSTEAFDLLMNMRIPRKEDRPAAKDPISIQHHSFIGSVCSVLSKYVAVLGKFLRPWVNPSTELV